MSNTTIDFSHILWIILILTVKFKERYHFLHLQMILETHTLCGDFLLTSNFFPNYYVGTVVQFYWLSTSLFQRAITI